MGILGNYRKISLIAQGGMGEVFLVEDLVCNRKVALKKIRSDLKSHSILKRRFLKEAHIAAQLNHPGVISVYTIHNQGEDIFYTMPYIEGRTLKDILIGLKKNHIEEENDPFNSIPVLVNIFRSICNTIAYVHSKGILHRDLKPDNVFIGKFGEVIIFDWGVAISISDTDNEELAEEIFVKDEFLDVTIPGKIVGTPNYMAPERLLEGAATKQTDIYSLGVMLYYMLTLTLPFPKGPSNNFPYSCNKDYFIPPEEVAPYKDIPPALSMIVRNCLEKDIKKRYFCVEDLLKDLSSHIDGKADWFFKTKLSLLNSNIWKVRENIFLTKHLHFSDKKNVFDWFAMMLSQENFSKDIRISATIKPQDNSGVGFLLEVANFKGSRFLKKGYCLWLSSNEEYPFFKLFRDSIEILSIKGKFLKIGEEYSIVIEKKQNQVTLFINNETHLSYVEIVPEQGGRVGILFKETEFINNQIIVSESSRNLYVSCLAIPDSFLEQRMYDKAIFGYVGIANSFPGRREGREALFRLGLTMVKKAKKEKCLKKKEKLFSSSLEEFAKLHDGPDAPLEYLGKALVYKEQDDFSEELKCLELSLRRYKEHPLVSHLKERAFYRINESLEGNRYVLYYLVLVMIDLFPEETFSEEKEEIFETIKSQWEDLPFLTLPLKQNGFVSKSMHIFMISLAFRLALFRSLKQLFFLLLSEKSLLIGDIIYSFFFLGNETLGKEYLSIAKKNFGLEKGKKSSFMKKFEPFVQDSSEKSFEVFFHLSKEERNENVRVAFLLGHRALYEKKEKNFLEFCSILKKDLSLENYESFILPIEISCYLQLKLSDEVKNILEKIPESKLMSDSYSYFILYGCYLALIEGEESALFHFSKILKIAEPKSVVLLAYVLTMENFDENQLFLWEKRTLYQHLILYYTCLGKNEKVKKYSDILKKEILSFQDI